MPNVIEGLDFGMFGGKWMWDYMTSADKKDRDKSRCLVATKNLNQL